MLKEAKFYQTFKLLQIVRSY